ncbi:MAG TPA: hypothetical protein PKA58_04205 [Polyangium sp.]|nr:hypothetical protein [Polyangium sp.]
MDNETAAKITNRLEACLQALSEVVQIADAHCEPGERKVVRLGVGHVLSEIQERLGDPIYRTYPNLIPKGVDYSPLEGPTLADMAAKIETRKSS